MQASQKGAPPFSDSSEVTYLAALCEYSGCFFIEAESHAAESHAAVDPINVTRFVECCM